MKKLALFLIIIAATLSQASAQHYRGFVDVSGTYLTSIKPLMASGPDGYYDSPYGLGITTSHGAQFKSFFVGAGLGARLLVLPDAGVSGVFAFAQGRYDFFGTKRVGFFLDLKLGYYLFHSGSCCLTSTIDGVFYNEGDCDIQPLYLQPAVGVRLRLKSHLGLNFMIGYQPLKFKYKLDGDVRNEYGEYETVSYSDQRSTPAITFSVGLDF